MKYVRGGGGGGGGGDGEGVLELESKVSVDESVRWCKGHVYD